MPVAIEGKRPSEKSLKQKQRKEWQNMKKEPTKRWPELSSGLTKEEKMKVRCHLRCPRKVRASSRPGQMLEKDHKKEVPKEGKMLKKILTE